MGALPRLSDDMLVDPDAEHLADSLTSWATRPPSESVEANIMRVNSLRYLIDRARDALAMGMATVNQDGAGKVGYKRMSVGTDLHPQTIAKYLREGREKLRGAA